MSSPNDSTASGEVTRHVGPNPRAKGLFRTMNRALGAILRSPLHPLLSHSLLLVEFTGRTTGRRYRTPVGYRRTGDVVTFHTPAPWRKNLRDGGPIRLWLRGGPVDAAAGVITEPGAVASIVGPVLERAPRLARFYNVSSGPDGRLNPDDLARLARKMAVVNVRIPEGQMDANRDEDVGESMRGKVVMVTGANAGIGKATALALAERGATVVMVSRNRAKGEMAAEEVIARSGNTNVELLVADLSSQDSVRQLAHDFLARHDRLDVLVNNAGVFMPTRRLTGDGVEATFATNYLAPFLLTSLLLPAMRAAAPSRIINVSSGAQAVGRLDLSDLRGIRRRYSGIRAYAASKLALVAWTYELARRLSGTGVTVNALEPGFVDTKLPGAMIPLPDRLARAVSRPFMATPEQGARTAVMLASEPRAQGYNGNFFSSQGRPIRSAAPSYDRGTARRLWDESARLTGVPVEALAGVPMR